MKGELFYSPSDGAGILSHPWLAPKLVPLTTYAGGANNVKGSVLSPSAVSALNMQL